MMQKQETSSAIDVKKWLNINTSFLVEYKTKQGIAVADSEFVKVVDSENCPNFVWQLGQPASLLIKLWAGREGH